MPTQVAQLPVADILSLLDSETPVPAILLTIPVTASFFMIR